MALPDNELSLEVIDAAFVGGRALSLSLIEDFETGGVALSDPSQGLMVQVWKTYIFEYFTIVTEPQDVGVAATIYEGTEFITEVSLTFDQNMRQIFAFVEGGIAKLDWYDTAAEMRVLTEYPNISNPRVSLDDKRMLQTGTSDIIFSYIRDGNLYFRQQRDRYTVEYLLASNVLPTPESYLRRTGMNIVNRFQWEIFDPWTQDEILADMLTRAADPTTEGDFTPEEDPGTQFDIGDSTIYSPDNEE